MFNTVDKYFSFLYIEHFSYLKKKKQKVNMNIYKKNFIPFPKAIHHQNQYYQII